MIDSKQLLARVGLLGAVYFSLSGHTHNAVFFFMLYLSFGDDI